jgi:hypothetical protein
VTGGLALRCFCGAVTQPLTALPSGVVNCHCGQCRRLSGAAFTTWVSFPDDALKPATRAAPAVRAFEVTPRVTRHFCTRCGAHLFTTDTRLPGIVGLPIGALDGGDVRGPTAHYFVDDSPAWSVFCDGLPRFGGESGTEPR